MVGKDSMMRAEQAGERIARGLSFGAGDRPLDDPPVTSPSRSPEDICRTMEAGGRRGYRARALRAAAVVAVLSVGACAVPVAGYRDTSVTIASAAAFDPVRYAGRWYEIARFPVPFQEGCTDTVAEYAVQADGTLSVVNTCLVDGAPRRIEGSAELTGPGRLEVSFDTVPFVSAPYWVLWVAEDYGSAVVGVPSGRAGWILKREPTISPDRLEAARQVLDFNGYDVSRLVMTPHTGR
jgi:apolipoprotein D and lipocalin family protein